MKALFDDMYAPSTIGKLLREFTFRHARQLESVLSAAAMCCYGKQARKFLSWLPDPVDSAVRRVDSTHVTSFMMSYARIGTSRRRPWFFTEGGLAVRAKHAKQPWPLSN